MRYWMTRGVLFTTLVAGGVMLSNCDRQAATDTAPPAIGVTLAGFALATDPQDTGTSSSQDAARGTQPAGSDVSKTARGPFRSAPRRDAGTGRADAATGWGSDGGIQRLDPMPPGIGGVRPPISGEFTDAGTISRSADGGIVR